MKAEKSALPLSVICENSIQQIKQAIAASLLVVLDRNKLLRLETYASVTSIAATLLQEGRPVAFISHRFTPREKAWSALELGAFAIVAACDKLCHFLVGREFEVLLTNREWVSFSTESQSLLSRMPSLLAGGCRCEIIVLSSYTALVTLILLQMCSQVVLLYHLL